jgi:hypothetical protein
LLRAQLGSTKDIKTDEEKQAAKLVKLKCLNCGEKGHPAKACPHKEEKVDMPLMAGMTLDSCCATHEDGRIHTYYEVCINNGGQVTIIDPCLLMNLHTAMRSYRSMNSAADLRSLKCTNTAVQRYDQAYEWNLMEFEDRKFVKTKARLVADGACRIGQYVQIILHTPWDLLKVDVGGVFLCAPVDEKEEYII